MAYATAVYSNLTPQLHSDSAIVSINGQGMSTGQLCRLRPQRQPHAEAARHAQPRRIRYPHGSHPRRQDSAASNAQEVLDDHARVIPESVSVSGSSGKYQIVWNVTNDDGKGVLMYAYPHHQSSISSAQPTNLTLASATHGPMKAYIGNMWTLTKPDLSTASWLPRNAAVPKALLQPVTDALDADLRQDWTYDCDRATNYFSGKALQKWALVALISNRPETGLAARPNAVQKLKDALAPFLGNVQQDPFNYDATYKGVVARCRITSGDAGCEFGHTHYNDHHFHQGYLIATAAVIKMLDPAWRSDELNAWTEALIRDVNNPLATDNYFPQFRYFDWFAGPVALPSAAPLTDATKNRTRNPSTSSGPQALGALNQQHGSPLSELTAAKRAGPHRERLLLPPRRQRKHPPNFTPNRVTGIHFEDKVDYTTYFGRTLWEVHGIQMMPMTPALEEARAATFVREEWERIRGAAPENGWASVLWMNQAIVDADAAFTRLQAAELDGGIARAWALYWAAAHGAQSGIAANATQGL
ncbi:glycosyl hydrolase family 81-domain-containing protein [Jimgerdemannia flammicorona]|uniref:glucan endo-1,3-beta-D-glucosidase n=1 Tax=Jimgerdemannia flammicorona TaxID=994334 RepID=A0A433D4G0_9FUNG|nr:glycosyl hydrolase family 81-domain-containing protein [Jimgerdemannia flammicorona]